MVKSTVPSKPTTDCSDISLEVNLGPSHPAGLRLRNPVLTASGTSGFGPEYGRLIDLTKLGALVTKTVTPRPRSGNPTPRTVETPAGMLNSIGLPNPGIQGLLEGEGRTWRNLGTPVIVSIAGGSSAEFRDLAGALEGYPGVAAIEANLSCPNVEKGMEFATNADLLRGAVAAIREASSLPLLAKLSPNVADMRPFAVAAQDAGAHGLTIMNTILAMKIDIQNRRPFIGARFAGLSGPAIRPIGVRFVYEVFSEVDIPIAGAGGIASAEDALEYILAGAAAVQVGTASFVRPAACLQIIDGLREYLARNGFQSAAQLVGAAHRR